MKVYNLTIYLVLLIFISGCNGESKSLKHKSEYNFSIVYDYTHLTEREDKYRNRCSYDNLYFFIETNFENDTIQIEVGKNKIIREVVNTNDGLGLAKVITVEGISEIEEVYFYINDSLRISFELIDKKMNLIGVRKKEKEIELLFYKRVPMYE